MRSSLSALTLSMAIVIGHSDQALAQRPCDGPSYWRSMRLDQQKLLSLLRARDFEELESTFAQRQVGYEAGKYREEDLYYAFNSFNNSDAALLPILIEWVKKYPLSYAARLSLGIHRNGLAWAARGNKLRNETSEEQHRLFRQRSRAAAEDLLRARTLAKKPISYFAFAVWGQRDIGSREGVDAALKDALALDPAAVMPRMAYINAIDPRWYGSFEELAGFSADLAKQPLDDSSRRYLRFVVEQNSAYAYWAWKDHKHAEQHLRKSAQYCDLARPWEDLANLYNQTKEWRKALDALDAYLRREPDQAWAIRRKAYAYQELGEYAKALPFWRDAAQLGDAYAQNGYGWYLLEGRATQKDVNEAVKWFRAAAQQGNAEAAANLERALGQRR